VTATLTATESHPVSSPPPGSGTEPPSMTTPPPRPPPTTIPASSTHPRSAQKVLGAGTALAQRCAHRGRGRAIVEVGALVVHAPPPWRARSQRSHRTACGHRRQRLTDTGAGEAGCLACGACGVDGDGAGVGAAGLGEPQGDGVGARESGWGAVMVTAPAVSVSVIVRVDGCTVVVSCAAAGR